MLQLQCMPDMLTHVVHALAPTCLPVCQVGYEKHCCMRAHCAHLICKDAYMGILLLQMCDLTAELSITTTWLQKLQCKHKLVRHFIPFASSFSCVLLSHPRLLHPLRLSPHPPLALAFASSVLLLYSSVPPSFLPSLRLLLSLICPHCPEGLKLVISAAGGGVATSSTQICSCAIHHAICSCSSRPTY